MDDTNRESNSLAIRRVPRKSHRKSRNGCRNCKIRRIKCDEQKPECSNCIRHDSDCSFLSHSPAQPSPRPVQPVREDVISPGEFTSQNASPAFTENTPSSIPGPTELSYFRGSQHPPLNVIDLELLHNYNTSTSYTFSNIQVLQNLLRINVPRMGFSYPYVLHGILAVSALHMSRFKTSDSKAFYLSEAQHHHEIALRQATALLPGINTETCSPLYIFTSLCSLFTLGLGPTPGDFLLYSQDGIPEWLVLFRGLRAIIASNFENLRNSELLPLFQHGIQDYQQREQMETYNSHLEELRELITLTTKDASEQQLYTEALENLMKSFPETSARTRATQVSPQGAFILLYRASDEFVAHLKEGRPVPLVILAHFCVILNDLSSFWWIKGWAEHLISEIYVTLDPGYRVWIRWPMEEIGWIPG